jgi:hypothetical protein
MAAYLHGYLFRYPHSYHVPYCTAPEIVEMPYPNPGVFASLFPGPVEPLNPVCAWALWDAGEILTYGRQMPKRSFPLPFSAILN